MKCKNIDDISTENSITSPDIQEEKCKINNNFILINYYFVSFLADENDVITTNDDIINTPDTQIQKRTKRKYYNNIYIYIHMYNIVLHLV